MHRVHHHAAALQPLGPQLGQDHLGALGARVDGRAVELLMRRLQVVDPDSLCVHAAGGHIDDAGGLPLLEQWDQHVRQQERSEDVGRKGQLDAVDREGPLPEQRTRVVDEHIEAWYLLGEALGELPYGVEVTEVAEPDVNIAIARPCDDLRASTLTALLAAGEQPHAGTETREALGGGEPYP